MSDEPEKTSYYLRLLSMYMDLGTEIVLDVFEHHTPGHDVEKFLQSKQREIIQLKNDSILKGQECSMLLQEGKDEVKRRIDIKSFDLSILINLSRNIFTRQELEFPDRGWNNPPRKSDKSVAADLLRLKRIRNVIVGHHPRAKLPFWRFENVWDEVSEILIRLQQHIAPDKKVHLLARIEACRLQCLDPTIKNKYDAKLKQWHNEVTTMQDQVEEMRKQLRGFEAYFNNKSDRFERYTKLLFKGGHFVLSAFLSKKIKDEGKDLRKMLMDNEDGIKKVVSDEEQLDKLYPCNPPCPTGPIDTSSWNVSLLSTVILQLFNSTGDEGVKESIKEIGEAHRKYATATTLALDANAFEDYWTDLKSSMNIVSRKLDKDTANSYYQILDECKKKIDEKEMKTYIEELKKQGNQIKSFTETYQDILQRAKDFLQDMNTNGISFKTAQDKTEHVEEEGLSLQMTVSSPAGMKHLTSLCSKGTISNCTNSIADALSKHLGGTIALKAIADMKEFKHVFDTDSSSSDSCSDYSSIESNEQDNNYPNPINAEDMDYISEGLTIKGRTSAEEELNKQIEGTTYALKTLKLTSNEKEPDETLNEFDEGFRDIVRGTVLGGKEEALKEQQDFKDSLYHGTHPVGRQSQRYLSDEPTKTLSIRADGEETCETIALLELYQSKKAVAQYLELAYDSLQYSPNIAREIISTSQFAKDSHEATFGYETFNIHLSHLVGEIRRMLFAPWLLSGLPQYVEQVRDETEQSKKRYITLQTYVRRNIQQVQQSICSRKVLGEDEHKFNVKMDILSGPISKDVSASKYEIERSQNKFTPDVTGIHQFKDENEEKLHKRRKGLMDIDFMEIDARKMKVEETLFHKLRPGLAFTGGIDVLRPVYSWELFNLIRQESESDFQYYADEIKNDYTDTNIHALIDHIVIQRKKEFDRWETIRKQEKNKGLECLKEVARHLENIDTQLTRVMNCWSELADDIEFFLKNVEIVHDILSVYAYDLMRSQEWEFVKELFNKYQDENQRCAKRFYRFVKAAEEETVHKRQHQLKYENKTTQGRSEYKRSELKSPISEKADKPSYLKSVITNTGKQEHMKKDEQQTSNYEH